MLTLTPQEQELERRLALGLCPDCGGELKEESGEYASADPSDAFGVSYTRCKFLACQSCPYTESL